jgi:hypothetical protein
VFGIARLFAGGIGDTDSVVPLKGLFVASSGELALVTSYDPNERLYVSFTLVLLLFLFAISISLSLTYPFIAACLHSLT